MNIRFEGKTVIVTGAAHGFGRDMTLAFAERGARVWACDIIDDELAETQRLCARAGGNCQVRHVDVADRDAVFAFVEEANTPLQDATRDANPPAAQLSSSPSPSPEGGEAVPSSLGERVPTRRPAGEGSSAILRVATAQSGSIDILVNNAGGVLGQVGRPLEEVSPKEWNHIFEVNVTGAFYLSQAVAPGMKEKRYGRIVNISSGAGLGVSLTGIQAYASAKAAQIGLTRQLAHELGAWNITVNSIAPGFVRSNPASERQWQSYGNEGQKALIDSIALKRLGQPEDIVYGVLFLASDYAGWITGQVLSIDGGK